MVASAQDYSKGVPSRKRRRFNWVISDCLRVVLKTWLEWTARFKGAAILLSRARGRIRIQPHH